jgi:ADP-heptose:LPS heptosyltransferase/polysaccharide pyruvyl transferase WcaK-like protein
MDSPSLPAGDIVLCALGGIGDLMLLADAARALKRARPADRLILVCRAAVAATVSLWPEAPDDVITIGFSPESWAAPDAALDRHLKALEAQLAGRSAALVIDAGLRSSWFPPVVAALLGDVPLAQTSPGHDNRGHALATLLLSRLGRALPPIRWLHDAPPRLHERQRHGHWLGHLGIGLDDTGPVPLAPRLEDPARARLEALGLVPDTYLICCPGGAGTTPIKRWPASAFISVLSDWPMPVLLIGSDDERPLLETIAAALPPATVRIVAAGADEIGLTAGLMALSRLWLSNDTGPMHVAQAYGRPGVALFGGGGRWPAYAPWGPGAIGLVAPLPCFGCDWDCPFGRALCVEAIAPADVTAALAAALANPIAPPRLNELAAPESVSLPLMAAASDSYQALRRQTRSLEDDALTLHREVEIQSAAAAERLTLVKALHTEAARRLDVITALQSGREPPPDVPVPVAIAISTGLGAGNIGDELMAEAFWQQMPPTLALDVALFPAAAESRALYPARHRYRPVDWTRVETAGLHLPGLLVGGTPVADAEGTHFPLQFIADRLRAFHAEGRPVDALGVGIEQLLSAEGHALFEDAFRPIRSWSVRSAACKSRLVALGCAPDTVHVGADWAWLHQPHRDLRLWAAAQWADLGLDPGDRVLVVNPVNLTYRHHTSARSALAKALNTLATRTGMRIALYCNECRPGEFFDRAAAQDLAARLAREPIFVPPRYWAPDEAIALLSRAEITLSQRYHVIVQSVLAGTLPVSIPRGDKQRDLADEIDIPSLGSMSALDPDALVSVLEDALATRPARLAHLAAQRRVMALRAASNLDLIRALPPYASFFSPPAPPLGG